MITPAFAQILRSGRDHFNGRFNAARRLDPALNGEAFTVFLRDTVGDVMAAVERVHPERATDVATAAYEIALELVGQRLVGPGSRSSIVEEGWRRLLPKIATLVAAAPEQILAAVSNALHTLATTPSARPDEWLNLMEKHGPACADVEVFLKLGQVAAWRSGLAHFRGGALTAADALPEALSLELVAALPGARWADVRVRLLANPWFIPADPDADFSQLKVKLRAGAFRGFGGLFLQPPRVARVGQHFLVSSGNDGWILTADACGATFHRAKPEEVPGSIREDGSNPEVRIAGGGKRVDCGSQQYQSTESGDISSAAATATTLAVTSRLTHAVVLIPLSPS